MPHLTITLPNRLLTYETIGQFDMQSMCQKTSNVIGSRTWYVMINRKKETKKIGCKLRYILDNVMRGLHC